MTISSEAQALHTDRRMAIECNGHRECPGCEAAQAALDAAREEGARAERAECARIAENPYGDEVQAMGGDEPLTVGKKIAHAIRERGK